MLIVFSAASILAAAIVFYILIGMSAMFFPSLSELFGPYPYRIQTDRKIIALTFDDGPNPPYTDQLLDILKRHDVRATFFLVGKNVEQHPDTVKRMAADGHVIGNHTYSHSFLTNFSKRRLVHELNRSQQVIASVTGISPTFARTPWLFRLPWILTLYRQHGLTLVSAEFGFEFEVVHQNADRIARRAISKARPGCILDFHDGFDAKGGNRAGTIAAIDHIITELKKRGYSFVTVDELFR